MESFQPVNPLVQGLDTSTRAQAGGPLPAPPLSPTASALTGLQQEVGTVKQVRPHTAVRTTSSLSAPLFARAIISEW